MKKTHVLFAVACPARQRRRGRLAARMCVFVASTHGSAIDTKNSHVPYRASKLTLILKDSFQSEHARVTMIAAVSPVSSAADHTINTLR